MGRDAGRRWFPETGSVMLDDGGAREVAVARRYLLPHERWLTNRLVQRVRARPEMDVARVEQEDGAESFWLDAVALTDLGLCMVTIIPGLILMVVIGAVFHEVAAADVTGLCIAGPGAVSFVLSGIRKGSKLACLRGISAGQLTC